MIDEAFTIEKIDRVFQRIVRGEIPARGELKNTPLAEVPGMSRNPVILALARFTAARRTAGGRIV